MASYRSAISFLLILSSWTVGLQPARSIETNQPAKNSIETPKEPDLFEQPDVFNDIGNHWSRHVINWLVRDNPRQISYINNQEQSFRPGCPITRGEWAMMSVTVLDLENRPDAEPGRVAGAPRCPNRPGRPCPFSDVPAPESSPESQQSSYYQATYHAFRTGMMSGYKDGTFRPQQPLTYAEAVASLANGLNLIPQIDALKRQSGEDPSTVGGDYFMNGSVIEDEWFAEALHGALLANLVALDWPLEFYGNYFPVSRGEAAVMMYLTLAYQGRASLDDPILKQETVPGSGEYAFRHIRKAGEPNFSFGPPYKQRQCHLTNDGNR